MFFNILPKKKLYTEQRPWGKFKVIEDLKGYKIKVLTVNPNSQLSLQKHQLRSELMFIVKGECVFQKNTEYCKLKEGEFIFINKNDLHRISNVSLHSPVVIAEIQHGECLESDIIRIEDDYNRN